MLRMIRLVLLVIPLLLLPLGAVAASSIVPDIDVFWRTWARTDKPVADGVDLRTWMWGPEAFTPALPEPYAESAGGIRTVQYFDKGRMEDNRDRASMPWDVTTGLLVVEMVEGKIQIGDTHFDESPQPAALNIAGDPGEFPTYADINGFSLQIESAAPVGITIVTTFTEEGEGVNPDLAYAGVTAAHYVSETHHTIASPFWDFMNATGTVYAADQYAEDQLFTPSYYATGLPITEAYWSTIAVGGIECDVLWQCFERRCLTFTPQNEPAWQVEASNVGRHYYAWRYETDFSD